MKILIAEDDDNVRTLIAEILTQAGHTAIPTTNGLQAWERLHTEGADLLVTDINMPVMDGLQLLSKIRSSDTHSALPALVLTIKALTEDQISGYETGADDYLVKPFDNEVFVARINALERRIVKKIRTNQSL
ncbi:MAG: response regulator transcription factor [Elusimicrobiales bacterium]|nr:response regulator transcription factor [Elusimicrobiales bacterium]